MREGGEDFECSGQGTRLVAGEKDTNSVREKCMTSQSVVQGERCGMADRCRNRI